MKRTTTGGGTGMSLTGPVAVVPGRTVRFTGTGFRPGGDVNVVLTPADRSHVLFHHHPIIVPGD